GTSAVLDSRPELSSEDRVAVDSFPVAQEALSPVLPSTKKMSFDAADHAHSVTLGKPKIFGFLSQRISSLGDASDQALAAWLSSQHVDRPLSSSDGDHPYADDHRNASRNTTKLDVLEDVFSSM